MCSMKREIVLLIVGYFMISIASCYANLSIVPSSSIVSPNSNFVVNVSINTNESVYAISFDVYFNSAVVRATNSSEAGFLRKDGNNVLTALNKINNTSGKISFAVTRTGEVGGVTGTGNIAKLNFIANRTVTNITISNIQVIDSNLNILTKISSTNATVISNNLPEARNITILPVNPTKSSNLTISYSFFDLDGDSEKTTQIDWYKNNVVNISLVNMRSIPSSLINKGEVWKVRVIPNDGISYGAYYFSGNVTIQNSAPVLATITNKTIQENQTLQFNISATDIDNDNLTFFSYNLPSGATFSNKSFKWKPSNGQAGIYYVTFNVSDGFASSSQKIAINVTSLNLPPSIIFFSPSNLAFKFREGVQLFFKEISIDPNNENLNYAWKVNNVTKASTQNYSYTPSYCSTDYVNFEVKNSKLSSYKNWNVSVYLRGDINLDNKINIIDLASIGKVYGKNLTSSGWNKSMDIIPLPGNNGENEGDNIIDIFDMAECGLNYGRTC